MLFPQPLRRVAAEIRSGQSANDVDDLIFELYDGDALIADLTVVIRGQDDFFFYGLASDVDFDRWVIRQRPYTYFDLENLRFEAAEPGTLFSLAAGMVALAARRRRRN
jgi:hypothetical protein